MASRTGKKDKSQGLLCQFPDTRHFPPTFTQIMRVRKIAIPLYDGVLATSVVGPFDMLYKGGEAFQQMQGMDGGPTVFQFLMVSEDGKPVVASGGMPLAANAAMHEVESCDLVLITAPSPETMPQVGILAEKWAPWLLKQYHGGAELASMCLGAFLLAQTGLLDGKRATTHWLGADQFKAMFPKVELLSDKIIVDEGRVCTCGGATSFTNLMLYLLEKYLGKETAIMLSKLFLVDPNKLNQNSYEIFGPQKQHSSIEIRKVQDFIEANVSEKIMVEELADMVSMTRRTFIRKFKGSTGNTPIEYIQRVRIEAAKRRFELGEDTIEQVVLDVGYEDVPSFRKVFKRFTGITPQEYRRRYSIGRN